MNPATVARFTVPPYASADGDVVGADGMGRVIVAAQTTTPNGATHHLEYLVTLEAGESRWRIAAIGSAAR